MNGEMEAVAARLLELLRTDPELHAAVTNLLNATAEAKLALAEYRRRKR